MPILNAIVDISHHQADIDFAAARDDGIVGVIHKATQGTSYVDPLYATRRRQALAAGLLWGAYHFGDGGDAGAQASHFLETVEPTSSDLVVLDYEDNPSGKSMNVDQARAFVASVQATLGRWPGLYSGHTVKDALGDDKDPVLGSCWFWLAQYGPDAVVPPAWDTWTMWQYTDGNSGAEPHSVAGIGACDRNKFNGDFSTLAKLWVGWPYLDPATDPAPKRSLNVYVASSWRNEHQPAVVELVRAAGHSVYDFRNPAPGENGFSWDDVDPEWQTWTPEQYREGLKHPEAVKGFYLDWAAMTWADAFILVQPAGSSSHLELGWAAGCAKETAIYFPDGVEIEPELMATMVDELLVGEAELTRYLKSLKSKSCGAAEVELVSADSAETPGGACILCPGWSGAS